jgi:hypothetical protein
MCTVAQTELQRPSNDGMWTREHSASCADYDDVAESCQQFKLSMSVTIRSTYLCKYDRYRKAVLRVIQRANSTSQRAQLCLQLIPTKALMKL